MSFSCILVLNVDSDVEPTCANVSWPEGSHNLMFAHIRGSPGPREVNEMDQMTKAGVQDFHPVVVNEHMIFYLVSSQQVSLALGAIAGLMRRKNHDTAQFFHVTISCWLQVSFGGSWSRNTDMRGLHSADCSWNYKRSDDGSSLEIECREKQQKFNVGRNWPSVHFLFWISTLHWWGVTPLGASGHSIRVSSLHEGKASHWSTNIEHVSAHCSMRERSL